MLGVLSYCKTTYYIKQLVTETATAQYLNKTNVCKYLGMVLVSAKQNIPYTNFNCLHQDNSVINYNIRLENTKR